MDDALVLSDEVFVRVEGPYNVEELDTIVWCIFPSSLADRAWGN